MASAESSLNLEQRLSILSEQYKKGRLGRRDNPLNFRPLLENLHLIILGVSILTYRVSEYTNDSIVAENKMLTAQVDSYSLKRTCERNKTLEGAGKHPVVNIQKNNPDFDPDEITILIKGSDDPIRFGKRQGEMPDPYKIDFEGFVPPIPGIIEVEIRYGRVIDRIVPNKNLLLGRATIPSNC